MSTGNVDNHRSHNLDNQIEFVQQGSPIDSWVEQDCECNGLLSTVIRMSVNNKELGSVSQLLPLPFHSLEICSSVYLANFSVSSIESLLTLTIVLSLKK